MTRFRYTEEMLDWLRNRVDGNTGTYQLAEEMSKQFGITITRKQVRSCLRNHHITTDYKRTGPAYNRMFTDEMLDWLRNHVDGKTSRGQIADELNERFGTDFSHDQVASVMKRYHIRSGHDTHFQKGVPSWITGRKVPDEVKAKTAVTMFKPGSTPVNTDDLGTIKDVGGYLWVKTNNIRKPKTKRINWTPKHILVWEEAHGEKVPDGMSVVFLNGNTRDFRPENLELMTKAEAGYYRGLMYKDRTISDDINRACANLAKLQRRINDAK